MRKISLLAVIALGLCIGCRGRANHTKADANNSISDSALISLFDEGAISRDSLLTLLKAQGRLRQSGYFGGWIPSAYDSARRNPDSISKGRVVVSQLRSRLNHRFALDYVLQRADSSDLGILPLYPKEGIRISSTDPAILEEFNLWGDHRLYFLRSFQGKESYYILADYGATNLQSLEMFSSDSSHVLLDSLSFSWGAHFEFDTVNGGSMMRIEYGTSGTGYEAEHISLVIARGDQFRTVFEDYLSFSAGPPWSDPPSEKRNNISFVDLNHDGFLDILEEETLVVATDSAANHWDPLAPNKLANHSTSWYLWNNVQCDFILQPSNQL